MDYPGLPGKGQQKLKSDSVKQRTVFGLQKLHKRLDEVNPSSPTNQKPDTKVAGFNF
jgi:hypothetical protein